MDKNATVQLINLLVTALTTPILYVIRYNFHKNFLGFKKAPWIYIILILPVFIFDFIYVNFIPNFLVIVISNLWLILILFFLCEGNLIIKIYAIIVENAILLLTNLILLPFEFWINPIINNMEMSFAQRMFVSFTHNILTSFFDFIILYILLKRIINYLSFKNKTLTWFHSIHLLLPCLSGYGLALIFYLIQEIQINNTTYYLPNIVSRFYYLILPLICCLFLFSIPISAYTFKKMIESEEYKNKNILIKQQFEMQLTHIKNIDSIYLGIRKVVHDMNNHISCLKNLADTNNWEEMKKYLYKISNTVSKLDFKIKTGNPICDAIINEKYNISQTEGINFQCEFLIPQNTSLDSIDLCVLLSNVLDNSIDACKKINNNHKFISIKSYVKGLYLIIEIINSSSEKLLYNGDKIITSKSDNLNHGVGLSNINDVVNKYNGALDMIEEINQVTLSIMLKAY